MILISRDNTGDAKRKSFENELAELAARRSDVLVVPHAYHIAEDDDLWGELAAIGEPIAAFAWLHPRPARWLLRRHAVGAAGLATFDLATFGAAQECLDACDEHLGDEPGAIAERERPVSERWYPVVDFGRCINCKQCLRFCLFGVYELSPQFTVAVAKPDNCKPGCPACARVCPNSAIMFPLHENDAAVAGAPGKFVTPDDTVREMFEKRTGTPHRAADDADDDDELDALIDELDDLTGGGRA